MEYVIGIDSGGTHYRVQAGGLNGRRLGEYTGCTANHYALSKQEVSSRVQHHIAACLAVFGGVPQDCRYIVCGTSGLDSEEDAVLLEEIYNALPGFNCPVLCINDAELAHYAVTGGRGVLVISGTGSIAFGRNRNGRTARVGGWSLDIMGEEGSGSWVSRHALRHLARYFDKIVPTGPLVQILQKELDISTPKQLADFSFSLEFEKQPKLGRLVDEAAERGDQWAVRILENAAVETMRLVRELVRVLGMENDPELFVGVWGSNIVDSCIHREAFGRLLAKRYPNARLCLPTNTATDGAVLLALERRATSTV